VSRRSYIDIVADDIHRQAPPERLPDEDDGLRALFRLYALLALTKGEAVTPRDVHDAWAVWMLDRDVAHEAIVPFDELPQNVQREDAPFVAAIRAAARQLRGQQL
jgi:hypothetical protein